MKLWKGVLHFNLTGDRNGQGVTQICKSNMMGWPKLKEIMYRSTYRLGLVYIYHVIVLTNMTKVLVRIWVSLSLDIGVQNSLYKVHTIRVYQNIGVGLLIFHLPLKNPQKTWNNFGWSCSTVVNLGSHDTFLFSGWVSFF